MSFKKGANPAGKRKGKGNGGILGPALVGGAVGAGVGAVVGASREEDEPGRIARSALLGGLVGAGVGAGVGLLTNGGSVTNEALFEIYNQPPDQKLGTRAIPEVMGPTPNLEEGYFHYKLPSDTVAYTVFRKDGSFADAKDFHGISLVSLVKSIDASKGEIWLRRPATKGIGGEPYPEVRMKMTKTARIHYRVAYPRIRSRDDLGDLPAMFALHGVPCSNEWKSPMLHDLGRDGVVIAPSMISMGGSTMLWEYHKESDETSGTYDAGEMFDWINDRDWVKPFMDAMKEEYGLSPPGSKIDKPGSQWDDWGTGIGVRYFEEHYPELKYSVQSNPIHTDGYFVIEIGNFAKASWMVMPSFPISRDKGGRLTIASDIDKEAYFAGLKAFESEAQSMPRIIVGVEKYMVTDENMHLFDRYTESLLMQYYQDTEYLEGRNARDMPVNFLTLALLCIRSARLAPRQLLPKHETKNPMGVDYVGIDGRDNDFKLQAKETRTLTPHTDVMNFFVKNSNHYVEWEYPKTVARIYREIWGLAYGAGAVPIRLGDSDFVWQGNEPRKLEMYTELFDAPRVHDPEEMARLYTPGENIRHVGATGGAMAMATAGTEDVLFPDPKPVKKW
jgi:hypothetical protein